MKNQTSLANKRLSTLVESLDIPPSYYHRAKDRYSSLGDWLHRARSRVAHLDPAVYPQGSFRYGTVIRPLLETEEYDLDLVCELRDLDKLQMPQRDLKLQVGSELKAYATAQGLKEPVEEKKRCWRLIYADTVSFHIDALPAVHEDPQSIEQIQHVLSRTGVSPELVQCAIAITDRDHPRYDQICRDWLKSNPRGFARWFEGKMRAVAQKRMETLVAKRVYASVDDVPQYEWKTPLQRAIQIMKRHRDVMFSKMPSLKPISMILTTLAAHSYQGEEDLYEAITNVVRRMPSFVSDRTPRVPNPVNPVEDFADKWANDSALEENFWRWCAQINADLTALAGSLTSDQVGDRLRRAFGVELSSEKCRALSSESRIVQVSSPAIITAAARPWAHNEQT